MKRLTRRWGSEPYPNLAGRVVCEYKECDSAKSCNDCVHGRIANRLAAIEDILCDSVGDNDPDAEDEYDLDRLAVMCNQRMSMRDEVSERFSLTAKIPLDRLRELAEADREGRCVVLPIKIPGWGWYCNDKFPNAISAYFDYPSQVVDCMEDYILRGTKEEAEAVLAKIANNCD